MKSYTDIKQSKKLAEILQPESADMCWGRDDDTLQYDDKPYLNPYKNYTAKEYYLPCWSLTALLNYLRDIDLFPEINADESTVTMNITYYNEEDESLLVPIHNIKVKAENFVDACYEMILKLHKEKLL